MTGLDIDGVSPNSIDPRSLGQRLRDGRLERQLDIAAVAHAIRAPHRLVEAIERDEFDRLGADIYIRGYLTSYARLVGVPDAAVAEVLARRVEEPAPLQSSAQISHARYLLDRYARKGAYVVLTASIVLPVLWFKDQLQLQGVDLRSLDAPVATAPGTDSMAPLVAPGFVAEFDDTPMPPLDGPARDAALTVSASLTPFQSVRDAPVDAEVPEVAAETTAVAGDGRGWHLRVSADSWVEVLANDGRRLEYGLLRAGDERHFAAGSVAGLAIGNVSGVTLHRDGAVVDLEPFRRANVARITVSSDGRLSPGNG